LFVAGAQLQNCTKAVAASYSCRASSGCAPLATTSGESFVQCLRQFASTAASCRLFACEEDSLGLPTCVDTNKTGGMLLGKCEGSCLKPTALYLCVDGVCVPSVTGFGSPLGKCEGTCSRKDAASESP
jgi:hypothetical protein